MKYNKITHEDLLEGCPALLERGSHLIDCYNCGKELKKSNTTLLSRDRHFCGKECRREYVRKKNEKKYTHLICDNCGKDFKRVRGAGTNPELSFCSNKCSKEYHTVTLTCHGCGETFKRQKANVYSGNNYCSVACRRKYLKEN